VTYVWDLLHLGEYRCHEFGFSWAQVQRRHFDECLSVMSTLDLGQFYLPLLGEYFDGTGSILSEMRW
jgi:hypothetical protein